MNSCRDSIIILNRNVEGKGGKRNASDYDVFYIAVKSDTEEQIEAAEEIIRLVEEYLEKDASKPK